MTEPTFPTCDQCGLATHAIARVAKFGGICQACEGDNQEWVAFRLRDDGTSFEARELAAALTKQIKHGTRSVGSASGPLFDPQTNLFDIPESA